MNLLYKKMHALLFLNLDSNLKLISLHALTGWTALRTMRMTAKRGYNEVVVLTDNGSTHNLIGDHSGNMLRLLVVHTKRFTIREAIEERLKCQWHLDKLLVDL